MDNNELFTKLTTHVDATNNALWTKLNTHLDARFAAMDVRFDAIDRRLDKMDERFDWMYGALDGLASRLDDDDVDRTITAQQIKQHHSWIQSLAAKTHTKLAQ